MPAETAQGTLSKEEIQRYARHIILPEFGREGQERLKRSSLLCIGACGLCRPLALALPAPGAGTAGSAKGKRAREGPGLGLLHERLR